MLPQRLHTSFTPPPNAAMPGGGTLAPAGDSALSAQYSTVKAAFAPYGGLLSASEVVSRMRWGRLQPISTVARWIVTRKAVVVDWRGVTLLPMFQLDPGSLELRDECTEIVSELTESMDNWEIALWFATVHPELDGQRPVDALSVRWHDVVKAARESGRADRP